MKSQANQSPECESCSKCGKPNANLFHLNCSHSLCVHCLTFAYHKYRSLMPANATKCLICEQLVDITPEELRIISEFTNNYLIPLIKDEEEAMGRAKHNDNHFQLSNNDLSSGNKQFKSHELSTEKVTPAGKGFYSRCQSPKSGFNQVFCQVHPEQELSIICFSCHNSLLCISCISHKKHSGHNIKTVAKGFDNIYEQIALSRLKGKEMVDRLEISKRRLEDRRTIIQERWDKTINTLRLHFNNLQVLVNQKCEEVLEGYSTFFQKGMEDAVRDGVKVDESLRYIRRQMERLEGISKAQANPIEIIRKSTQLMQEIGELKEPQTENGEINQCDADRVVRDVVHLCERLEKIQPYCKKESLKTHGVDNYKSEEKLLKDNYFKRVKTNVMSLNSSRDRKEKKCTKTEEDQKRNKSKANYKTQSSTKLLKVNKALPAYLLQHLDKQIKESPLPECLMDFNPLQSSFKSTSKILSKSHIPSAADQHRRKKQHVAYIKQCLERKERKTFNATSKQPKGATQGMKKKKIPF